MFSIQTICPIYNFINLLTLKHYIDSTKKVSTRYESLYWFHDFLNYLLVPI